MLLPLLGIVLITHYPVPNYSQSVSILLARKSSLAMDRLLGDWVHPIAKAIEKANIRAGYGEFGGMSRCQLGGSNSFCQYANFPQCLMNTNASSATTTLPPLNVPNAAQHGSAN